MSDPKFIVYTGPMFGSKTTKMLSVLERSLYQRKKVIAFKPRMDDRYAEGQICTHAGLRFDARNVSTGEEIIQNATDADVIGVDEAFMIDGCAGALITLYKQGKTIVVSSIQMSATGNVFEEVKDMLPWATMIEVCPAVCVETGRNAYYTVRKVESLEEIEVGGGDMYEPRCWEMTSFVNKGGCDE
jgi:thymidine kinase